MGKLFVVGVGTGKYEDLTIKAYNTLVESDLVFCDEKMYQLLSSYLDKSKLVSNSYNATRQRCINAVNAAHDKKVSIVGSGDTGIYGIAPIILELCNDIEVEIVPGMTSFLSAASTLGSPLTKDFAVISLSDNFNEKDDTRHRIEAVAKNNFAIVFYSPCNSTHDNLIMARDILLQYRDASNVVGIVKNLGSSDQQVIITNIRDLNIDDVDSLTTIIVGRDDTKEMNLKLTTPLY